MPLNHTQNNRLLERAAALVPGNGGVYGHMNIAKLAPGSPQFYSHGEGARIWDVDGNSYIDFMCGWGPIILGRANGRVDAAARREQESGDCLNGPTPRMVELAEELRSLVDHADWSIFVKNGTDATTVCGMVARAATERRALLVARGAYHGSAPWATPSLVGTTTEERANLITYEFNDLESVARAFESAGDDVAGVVVSPHKHDAGFDQEDVDPAFARGLRDLCDRSGAALILDDVRCGLRLSLNGSWGPLGVEPDLSAWGKALANGYAIYAVLGREKFYDAASRIFVTGSFWYSGVAMAAALETVSIMREEDGVEKIRRAGQEFRDGLEAQAADHGFAVNMTGPVQIPYMSFKGDRDRRLLNRFVELGLENGVFLHPAHNWFLSTAHTPEVIEEALVATGRAFAALAEAGTLKPVATEVS